MKARWLLLATGIVACATTADSDNEPNQATVIPDASVADASDDASDGDAGELDAAPCVGDCVYFPATCTPDAFCPNGPFASDTAGGALDRRAQINVIRGRSATDVWVAGALGALAHFDGASWTRSDSGGDETLRALWLRDSSEVTFGILGRAYMRGLTVSDAGPPSPSGWTTVSQMPAAPEYMAYPWLRFVSAWAAPGASSLWLAVYALQSGNSSGLWRMRLSPASELEVALGIPPSVCHTLPCSRMTSLHGASSNVVWAVGEKGAIIRIDEADSEAPSASAFYSQTWNALNGVWAASDNDVWAVGGGGIIRHYQGHAPLWEMVDAPVSQGLNAIAGASASDIWAVGDEGIVLHYDGTTWSRVNVAGLGSRRPNLTTIWVASPGHVWIGGQGVVLSLGGKS